MIGDASETIPLLAVGGINFDVSILSEMLSTADSRDLFIRNAINFLRQYGFMGIDLDFEYPPPADKYRFSAFLQVILTSSTSFG